MDESADLLAASAVSIVQDFIVCCRFTRLQVSLINPDSAGRSLLDDLMRRSRAVLDID